MAQRKSAKKATQQPAAGDEKKIAALVKQVTS